MISEDSRKWWVLGAMGAILGVILLDETVVGVALPTIQRDLALSEIDSHWVVNVYMLVLAGLAAAAGKLGDIVGHKALVSVGLALFGLASLACGFAGNGFWLIAARAVQGAGAAIIFPSSLAMVTIAFPESQRGFALGLYGAVGTIFLASGPLAGGLLTDVLSWRWIFWVNPPVVLAVALVVLAAWREPPRAETRQRLDKTGLILLVAGLSMFVFAVMEGPEWGWGDPAILALLLAGLLLLAAFVRVERAKTAPLIEVDLFANPTFTGCNLAIFTAQFGKMALFVFGALYFQEVLQMSPLMAGVALLPTVAVQPVTAPLAGRAADRYSARRPVLISLAAMFVATAGFAAAMNWGSYVFLFPGLLIWGLCMAFLFVPPQRAVMSSVPPDKHGQAGGIAMSSQLLGATLGMAFCSTLFTSTGSYQTVFLATAAVSLAVLVIAWLTIERHGPVGAAAKARGE